ncbi:hypothetical protein AVEN_52926-1 [Araneus ventricosus]|uniref:Peptidase aspartic putative domain-containing protein n=1 Tax=Araneus ventricosus TaxID=182803 RepID=A0A4Y2FDH5_ARAVE|nr:hypothetical protein AVEN_52926-1 [Araneus ventricosus]
MIHFPRENSGNPASHLKLDAPAFVPKQSEEAAEANSQSQFVAIGIEKGKPKNVLLSTIRALVKNKFSQWDEVRCLLDVGPQSCLCTKACAEGLQLKMEKNTVFGYVVSGSVDQVAEDRVHCGLILDDDLNKTLKHFWEIESVDVECTGNTEASLCEDHFVRTHKRNKDGRYVVSMALNRDPSCLGNSKDMAVRQLNSLWKRLSRDSEYLSLYTDFLREYEDLGHLQRVVESSEPPTQ